MAGIHTSGRVFAFGMVLGAALLLAPRANAVEAFDGRAQLHGFFESQTRVLSRNFDGNDDFDLAQWYLVGNLEFEFDVAPDGFGPFDIISAYARVEARFDCVWDHACGIFPGVNTYGDRATHLPKRLSDSRKTGYDGNRFTGDVRKRHGVPIPYLGTRYGIPPDGPLIFNSRRPMRIWNVPGITTLFGVAGPDQIDMTSDDPAAFILSRFDDFEFASRKVRGSVEGVGTDVLGPWLPRNFVEPIGALADKPNPFNPLDLNPVVLGPGGVGSTASPYRPAPTVTAGRTPVVDQQFARGIYYPNPGLIECIQNDCLDNLDQNFRESELKWNRGASQQQTHFLKEAYVDIELFDSQLWLRLGKQSIVWGKTELFRTTDQFNPQDVALATLPSLEESRIALWAARAVLSLWQVGPLEDVRLEIAANLDTYQGADFGQCGEPYTVNAACALRAGAFAHGITGYGLAGISKPVDWWQDIKGLEVGFRAEFRYGAFSFAITDFWGYDDFPFVDQLFRYERNVDPFSGRPREANSRGRCRDLATDPACLLPSEALTKHSVNQQLFAFICSTSIGFTTLDVSVCAQSVFNSKTNPITGIFPDPVSNVSTIISAALAGDAGGLAGGALVLQFLTGLGNPLTSTIQAADLPIVDLTTTLDKNGDGIITAADDVASNLSLALSTQQKALLGCGPFYGTSCHGSGLGGGGIDLLNTEASMLTNAWASNPNLPGARATHLDGRNPGTIGNGAARFSCQRWVNDVGLVVLPGCRTPEEAGWDIAIDGDPSEANWVGFLVGVTDAPALGACQNPADPGFGLGYCRVGHPISGERFSSVMDAFSWNFEKLLVVFTLIGVEDTNGNGFVDQAELNPTQFDPSQPLATDRCSWVNTAICSNVSAVLAIVGRRRNSVIAGGSSQYGRADFVWHGGSSNRLKHKKRNVLGFSMDFAEDITKTNWSVESTWFHNVVVGDNDSLDGVSEVDTFNMTVSVDRPTFVNFLNQNRTVFINSQWFFQWTEGFRESMPRNGPMNVLATLTAFTGFYQDRLNPSITAIYDFMSESGGILPSISYRFNESFSVEFGMAFFYGKWQSTRMGINPISLGNEVGSGAYRDFSERGLGIVRDRDEAYVRLRKTF